MHYNAPLKLLFLFLFLALIVTIISGTSDSGTRNTTPSEHGKAIDCMIYIKEADILHKLPEDFQFILFQTLIV